MRASLRTCRLVVCGLAVLYCAGHLSWYGGTPLGGYPVLDGREILAMARAMADGTLVAEPFYRAPLYPALISVFLHIGVPDAALPEIARLINLLAHTLSALMVFELAWRLWERRGASLLAGSLYALYPVVVHFSGDPLDIIFSSALALASTLAFVVSAQRNSWRFAMAGAVLLALAVLARPNFLICTPAIAIWILIQIRADRRNLRLAVGALAGFAVIFGSMGLVNHHRSGEFRLVPWQGSHGLWDSNGPAANGLFYSHSIDIPDLVPGENPARAEALILYCKDRTCTDKLDIDDFQQYWRARTLEHVRSHPRAWLSLLADKAYYIVNNYEQYNNKTYWIHKDRSPWLRWNPLGWGLILALALSALWFPSRAMPRNLIVLLIVSYVASLMLYLVSARFRVPLVGWVCVLAGGWMLIPELWRSASSRKRAMAAIASALAVVAVAWIPVNEGLRQGTITEDWMLMSSAALAAGRWQESDEWASKVLAREPRRTTAHAMICSARFYAWEKAPTDALPPLPWLQGSLGHCLAGSEGSHRAQYNAAFFLSALCRQKEAIDILQSLGESDLVGALAHSALAALDLEPPGKKPETTGLLELRERAAKGAIDPGQRSILNAVTGTQCNSPAPAPSS